MSDSTDLHWQAFGAMHYTLRQLTKLEKGEPIGNLLGTVEFALGMVKKAEDAKIKERERAEEEKP